MPAKPPAKKKRKPRAAAGADGPDPARERRALELFLRQATDFRLALALYNDVLERDATIRSLLEDMAAHGLRVLTLDLHEAPPGRSLLDLVKSLAETAAGERVALMVINLESRVDYTPELSAGAGPGTAFAENANLHRDLFPAACPGPLVLWMTELLERAFVRFAPDLWHWRSHVFDLRTRRTSSALKAEERATERLASDDYRRHPEDRLRRLEEELAGYRKAGSRWDEMRVLSAMGLAHLDSGNAKAARRNFEAALSIARAIGDRRGEGDALGNLGLAYGDLGDVRKAIEFYEQHRVIARESGDRGREGTALGNLGLAHFDLGDPGKAMEFFEQHRRIARALGDGYGEQNALGNLGNAHAALGDTRKAIEFYEQALVVARSISDRRGEGICFLNLGNAYARTGDARKAIDFYEQALVIAREIGDRRGEGNASFNLAIKSWLLGDRQRARELMDAASKIFAAIEDAGAKGASAILQKWSGEIATGA